jgi:undecaprenyl diphosphate synthase
VEHISFIADGSRRWAKRHMLSRGFGHSRGFNKMLSVADHCADLGIPVVSFFAFSTENWGREQPEIDEIFRIIRKNISKQTARFVRRGIRVRFLGDLSRFPDDFRLAAKDCMAKTDAGTRLTMLICANYGGRADIVQAVNNILSSNNGSKTGGGVLIDEETFSRYLYGAEFPEPDIVVRTGGEYRISNFMLWQTAYAELFFTDILWPDITNEAVDALIAEFHKRDRRKGK